MRAPTILFRCDASPALGLGHLMRCIALAEALRTRGARPVFVVRADGGQPPSAASSIGNNGTTEQRNNGGADAEGDATSNPALWSSRPRLLLLEGAYVALSQRQIESVTLPFDVPAFDEPLDETDAFALIRIIRDTAADAVVIDHYGADERYLAVARAHAPVLGVIDDLADRALQMCDWILNPSPAATALPYQMSHGAVALLGPTFALLRPEFSTRADTPAESPVGDAADTLASARECLPEASDEPSPARKQGVSVRTKETPPLRSGLGFGSLREPTSGTETRSLTAAKDLCAFAESDRRRKSNSLVRDRSPSAGDTTAQVEHARIVVTLGGGDQSARLNAILNALRHSPRALHVRCIGRPFEPGVQAMAHSESEPGAQATGYAAATKTRSKSMTTPTGELPRSLALGVRIDAATGSRIEWLDHQPDIAPVLAWADVVVTGGGATCWELCALGVPQVAIALEANQEPNVAGIAAIGAGISLGRWNATLTPAMAGVAVESLLASPALRARMSQAGRSRVDGGGAGRAAQILLDRIASNRALGDRSWAGLSSTLPHEEKRDRSETGPPAHALARRFTTREVSHA